MISVKYSSNRDEQESWISLLILPVLFSLGACIVICLAIFSPLLFLNLVMEWIKNYKIDTHWLVKISDTYYLIPAFYLHVDRNPWGTSYVFNMEWWNRWSYVSFEKRKEDEHGR